MFQWPHPEGIPSRDPIARQRFNGLLECAATSGIPEKERAAIVRSVAKTYVRASYHEYRFYELRAALEVRRAAVPGEVKWDSLLEYVHFELQAFAGAARMLLDEIVYITARVHGVPPNRARKSPWETHEMVRASLPAECDVPEVRALAARAVWFDTLNAFRNTFYHHGWTHGGGHYSSDDSRLSSQAPEANGLLVPDRESLRGRSKPHEWTWTSRRTIDDVAAEIRNGLDDFLEELFREWKITDAAPGTMPRHLHPNMIVALVRPAVVLTPKMWVVPVFSTLEKARQCEPLASDPNAEPIYVTTSRVVIGQRALSISMKGLENTPERPDWIELVLDPIADAAWTNIRAASHARINVKSLLREGTIQPLSWPIDIDRVWVWRERESH